MKNSSLRGGLFAAIGLALALAPAAQAHPGQGTGLIAGLVHPLTGLDHLSAMLALGLWAALLGGPARWLVPAAFLGALAAGATAGRAFGPVPGTEQAIAASVFVLGLMIASAARLPVWGGAMLAGLFALFHGLAHGAEMPATALGLAYAGGFLVTSAALIAAGLLLGHVVWRRSPLAVRLMGVALAACTLLLLVQS